jgi:sugar phosphate permease
MTVGRDESDGRAAVAGGLKDSPQRWWLMVLLIAGMMICYAHRGALSVAAPSMMKELGLSEAEMGLLLSAFFLSYSLMQVPAGWLVDRLGVRRSYAAGFIFWSAASVLTGFARSLPALGVMRVLVGVGQTVSFPASARAVANWFQNKERGVVTAGYLTGVRLGQALVSAVGGYFLFYYDWKLFFIVISVVPMIWLLPWQRFLGRWEEQADDGAQAAVSNAAASGSVSFVESFALLKDRTVFGIFLGFFAYDYAWFVYINWLPTYLANERKFTPQEMGVYSAVPYLVMSVIILLAGAASDYLIRRGRPEVRVRKAFIVAGLLVGCLIVPAGLVEDKMTAVWLLTISLSGMGLCSPNTWTLTQAVCSKNLVGTVSGIQNFGGNLGGFIAPALTGYIAHRTQSFSLALSITGALLAAGIFSYVFLIRRGAFVEDAERVTV